MFLKHFKEKFEAFLSIVHSKWMVSSVYTLCTIAGFLFVYSTSNIELGSFIKLAFMVSTACFLLGNSMYNLNDLFDKSSDQLNNREKPLSEGTVTPNDVIITTAILATVSMVLLGIVNITTLFIGSICLILGMAYSVPPIRLKNKIWGKTTTITSIIMLSTIIGGFSLNRSIYPLFFMTLSIGIFVELICHSHDIRDMKGDRIEGGKTLPVILGKKPTITLAGAGYGSLIALSLLGVYYLSFNYFFPVVMFFIALFGFRKIKSIWPPNGTSEDYKKMRIVNRISIIAYALTFSLGAL